MSNKAFGFFQTENGFENGDDSGNAFKLQFIYTVVTPLNPPMTTTKSVTVSFVHDDTPLTIWQKVVSQVQVQESDSTVQVVCIHPSGLEYLVLGNSY